MERNRNIRKNAGFERVQRLKGNVGLIELSGFYRPLPFKPKLVAAMNLLADTSALIIDLRDCGGGDPESVMLAASYFFDRKTHLNDIYWRDEDRTEERWTAPDVEGARYGEQRPMVVLTSEDTGSACEDFSYAMKMAGRAITLGERTVGAAHAGTRKRLSDHFRFFLPTGRPINPVTHTDWETVGVQPDVEAKPKRAIEMAHRELLKKLIASETDPDWKRKLGDTLRDIR
jgi:C-terminal processing protease CtpA/Prc